MADPIQIIRSRDRLKRVRGGRDGLYPFLENLTWDIVQYEDEFWGDEIRGSGATPGIYEIVTGVDGAINILANQQNGVAELRASDGAGGGDEHAGLSVPGLGFTGDRNAVIAVRFNIDAITNVKVEVGFTDVTTDAGAVLSLADNTRTATDAAVWCLDTTDNGNWQACGVDSGVIPAKIEDGLSPTAGTFETLIVALRDTNARFYRLNSNGEMTYDSDWMINAITDTVAVVPWVFVQERTGVDRNVRIDFIDVRARRTVN